VSYGESCYVAAVLVRLGSIRLVLVRYGLVRLGGHGMVRSVTEWCCGAWRVEAVEARRDGSRHGRLWHG